jgi:pyruvate dehydrogenase E2 component (dihydrolipoamide acetyltransferase)
MEARADFVMPKLGLTMTEGRVAHWAIAPGAQFAAGDVLVVVETDKIAYDVEAPGRGRLAEILVHEGETAAVGTPIARWMTPDGAGAATGPTPATVEPAPALSGPRAMRTATRIIATPYARRLAREGRLDLTDVVPANGHRITAADIKAALARQAETASAVVNEPAAAQPVPQGASPLAGGFAFYGAEVRVDRLLRLIDEIGRDMSDPPSVTHFVILAAARALGTGAVIGVQHDDGPARILPPDATSRLSAIVAADRVEPIAGSGPATLFIADATGTTLVGRTPSSSGPMLGVGAPAKVFRPDAEGRPVLHTEVRLVLGVGDADVLPGAAGIVTRIGALLESPLGLLAT